MDLWLVLVMLAFLPAGYWLMKRLDVFLSRPFAAPDGRAAPEIDLALFAGEELLRGLCPALKEAGISFDVIRDGDDLSGRAYRLVCALGENDLQNLLICSVRKKLDSGCAVLARCNDPLYRNLYRDAGARCLDETEITALRIAGELRTIREHRREPGGLAC